MISIRFEEKQQIGLQYALETLHGCSPFGQEKIRRLQGMIDLQNQLSEESNHRDIGKTFEVLIEGFSKRSREQLFGRTSQNKVVIFDKQDLHVGQFIQVKITRASSATLFGEVVK